MTTLDWAVLGSYLAAIVTYGVYMGRGNKGMSDFFLAGREMRWWAVGLSVMATQISAITFIGTTGQAYISGMSFLVVYFALPFAMVILCLTLVPFFYRSGVFTAYEYLERRFGPRTRTFTSLLFLMQRGLSVGVTLYAPALVMSVLLGWSEPLTIALMGGSTIAYVLYGGNKSVIWTDVAQMAIIWFGIFLCFGVAIYNLPVGFGFRDALSLAQVTGRLRIMNTSPSLTTPYTLWEGLIGGLFLMLSYFGCDQSQVQRYLSGSSLTQSRLSLLFNAFLKVPMQFFILLTGVLVFVFYHFQEPPLLWNRVENARLAREAPPLALQGVQERFSRAHAARRAAAEELARARHEGREPDGAAYLKTVDGVDAAHKDAVALLGTLNGQKPYNDTNYIFPTYIVGNLPHGLAGLVVAVIFAAAMSTLSGELNSLATATMVDFHKRYLDRTHTGANDLLMSRVFTGFWGLFACAIALRAGQLGSVIEVVNKFGSLFYGSILGVFGLAVLTRRANATGAVCGLVLGMASVAFVSAFTRVHFLWWNVVGAVVVFASGYVISLLTPEAEANPAPEPEA